MNSLRFSPVLRSTWWAHVALCLVLLVSSLAVLPATPSVAQGPSPFQRAWAFEFTEAGQYITFVNDAPLANSITVRIYNPNGTENAISPKTVSLLGYESQTIEPEVDWGLATTSDGSPTTDTAYGMVATADELFGVMVWPDEMLSGFASKQSAIWAQNTVAEAWWGMYNPPAETCNSSAREYFFVFNPGDATANVSANLYKTDGTAIGTNPRTFSVGPHQTRTVFLEADLASAPGSDCDNMGYPGPNQNISVNLTSDEPVNVSVYTSLGNDWDTGDQRYKVHGNTAGIFVAYGADCYQTGYTWAENRNGAATTAARVTNPNSFPITVRQTFYPDDGAPASYTKDTTVAARGTVELPMPDDFETGWKNEALSGKYRHYFTVEAIDDPANQEDARGAFSAHVSYDTQIDWPAPWKTDWWWGSYQGSATDELFLINPYDDTLYISVEYSLPPSYGSLTLSACTIALPAGEALELQLPSDTPPGCTNPSVPSYTDDATLHFFSDRPFPINLELTYGGSYGDLCPWDCGGEGGGASEYGDAPDTYGTLDASDGPEHFVSPSIYLGTEVDQDIDGQPTSGADGDDDNPAGGPDDEDGVTFSVTTSQVVATVTAYNNTGSTVYLVGWVDLDGDGTFEDAERQAVAVPSTGSPQVFELTFTEPTGLPEDGTYARFRIGNEITSDPGTQLPTGFSGIGEVEDYLVQGPTGFVLEDTFAAVAVGQAIQVTWQTELETGLLGFNLYRAEAEDGVPTKLNAALMLAEKQGSPLGASYAYTDRAVAGGVEYFYWLELVDHKGARSEHGPVSAIAGPPAAFRLHLPFVMH